MIIRVVVFYVLTLLFTVLLAGLQQVTGLDTMRLTLPQWGPGLAALVMLVLFRRDGFRLSLSGKGISPLRLLAALLIPAGVGLVVYAIVRPGPDVAAPSWQLMLPGMAIGALGEELGWRGYLHKRIDPALRPLVSTALVGVLWAFFHMGLWANGVAYMALFIVLAISYSIVLYWLLEGTRFNVGLAALFHLGINVANLPFLGIISGVGLRFILVNAVVWTALAAVVVLRRRDLFLQRGPLAAATAKVDARLTGDGPPAAG